jgi:hypothetical protein
MGCSIQVVVTIFPSLKIETDGVARAKFLCGLQHNMGVQTASYKKPILALFVGLKTYFSPASLKKRLPRPYNDHTI